MAAALNWINAMCYDFHGTWDTTSTSEHAKLYDPWSNISTIYGLESWIVHSQGADSEGGNGSAKVSN
ncbi:hypothetical protein Cni_G16229 [Canna indica]|uniref:GH18 domain-containing protein n=1 Tax=Canna indica TaxID=4628 RepID=A0AAQ3KJT0_9LILI|nr:hypothetical protein Cni_G16229 [Canna indica]